MKRLFVILLLITAFVFASDAMAGPVSGVTAHSFAGKNTANTFNEITVDTGKGDQAGAGGNGYVTGFQENFASASGGSCKLIHDDRYPAWMFWKVKKTFLPNPAYVFSSVFLIAPEVDVNAYALDTGNISKSGSSAGVNSDWYTSPNRSTVFGRSIGKNGGLETSYSQVGLGADLYRWDTSIESRNNGYAQAFNESGAEFYTTDSKTDTGKNFASTRMFGLSGSSYTKGFSQVSVDNTGSFRSAISQTQNQSSINIGNKIQSSAVYGNGSVAAAIINGGSIAQGGANFNYTGQFSGKGAAGTYNTIKALPGATIVTSTSSSYSIGN